MRYALALVALLALFASPALAGDGNVSPSTLKSLGLSGMELVSDAEGMQVRGMSSNAAAAGVSFAGAVAIDGLSFAVGADVNLAAASAENAGLNALSQASVGQIANAVAVVNAVVSVATASGESAAFGQ